MQISLDSTLLRNILHKVTVTVRSLARSEQDN